MSGEQIEMVRGRQALKLNVTRTAAPTPIYEDKVGVLQPVEVGSETRAVEIEIDGWLLGPLHVADYDVRETLERLAPTGARPPGWGTVSQIRDPRYSARAFFGGPNSPTPGETNGLLDIHRWQHMSLTDAAQAVQRSAFPEAYAKWEVSAWNWLFELT